MTEPSLHFNIEIDNFEDFATCLFVLIDDLYNQVIPEKVRSRRNINQAIMSDSEIITLAILGELLGMDSEKAWYSFVSKNLRNLFPNLCERSRFNRTRRFLYRIIKEFRLTLNLNPDIKTNLLIIDSFPLPVCKFGRAYFSQSFKGVQADYGYCPSKKETYFGYKVHALCTLEGDIVDFLVTPASVDDRGAVFELLEKVPSCKTVIADKGYIGEEFAQEVFDTCGVCLIALKRRNSKTQFSDKVRKGIIRARRRIETTFSQLAVQLNCERTWSTSLLGLMTRLETKMLALSCCYLFNRLLKRENISRIKGLIF